MEDLHDFDEAIKGSNGFPALKQLKSEIVKDLGSFAESDAIDRNAVKRGRRKRALCRGRHVLPNFVHGFSI